jgi:hypothetical protein
VETGLLPCGRNRGGGIDLRLDVAAGLDRLGRDAGRGRDVGHELAEIDRATIEVAELEARRREQAADQVVERVAERRGAV